MIKLRNLSKTYISAAGSKKVLDNIAFDIPQRSFTTIFGPNGCGKTTLVNILTGLDKDFTGAIEGLQIEKHEIGYVFQDYRRSLLPWYSVKENILFPLTIQGIDRDSKENRLKDLLSFTSIKLDLDQRVFSLSGGQAQVVCILRALIINPRILILDEPFAALDYELTLALRRLISDTAKAMNLTVLFISHDLEEAISLGDQVIFLSKNPTRVIEVLDIDLPYPRTPDLVTSSAFNKLREKALKIFKVCVESNQYVI